jgi:hypothetical protein
MPAAQGPPFSGLFWDTVFWLNSSPPHIFRRLLPTACQLLLWARLLGEVMALETFADWAKRLVGPTVTMGFDVFLMQPALFICSCETIPILEAVKGIWRISPRVRNAMDMVLVLMYCGPFVLAFWSNNGPNSPRTRLAEPLELPKTQSRIRLSADLKR